MIAPIQKGEFFKGIVDYNYEKVAEGNGEIIGSNLVSTDKKYVLKHMYDTSQIETNEKRKNVVFHTSLNLPHGEDLSNKKFREISEKYLEYMGYINTPYIIIRHNDTLHNHVHIVASRVDYNGKLIKDSNDFYNSKHSLRQLEKDYGLKLLDPQTSEKHKEKLQEINTIKYQFSNALSLAKSVDDDLLNTLPKNVSEALKGDKKQLSDANLKKLFYSNPNGKVLYKNFQNRLIKNGYVSFTKKQQLSQILAEAYEKSNSKQEYLGFLDENGIYYRELRGKKGNAYIQYGLKDDSFYLGDYGLSSRYRLEGINAISENKQKNAFKNYKTVLRSKVLAALSKSDSIEVFNNELGRAGVMVQFSENSAGVYGVKFKVEDNSYLKGSELDRNKLSWKVIQETIKENNTISFSQGKEVKPSIDKGQQRKPDIKKGRGASIKGLDNVGRNMESPEDEGLRNLKKQRKKDNDKEQSL